MYMFNNREVAETEAAARIERAVAAGHVMTVAEREQAQKRLASFLETKYNKWTMENVGLD